YASMGFEAACILSSKIENPSKNAPKAILISYGIALSVATIYQFMFYGSLGTALSSITLTPEYLHAFPVFLQKLLPHLPKMAFYLQAILHLAIASSALGGSYGIMFSNTWNLFTIAKNKHIFFSKLFTKFNKSAIPFASVIFIGIIYITYLLVSGGSQMHLAPMSSLGVVLAYTLSVLALFIAKIKRSEVKIPLWVPAIGLVNCSILIYSCIKTLIEKGLSSLVMFTLMMLLGIIMFFVTQMRNKTNKQEQAPRF
ncbi:amino acid permease, partial [Candidatus Dependentiae bacterium]